ncbi:hypothetical protein Csa_000707 [Cucumis sativus]|nr:hypothetical protein Csa_000707 [Cucumis sativus]
MCVVLYLLYSALLAKLLSKKASGKGVVLGEEYELVHQTIFTDPDDRSVKLESSLLLDCYGTCCNISTRQQNGWSNLTKFLTFTDLMMLDPPHVHYYKVQHILVLFAEGRGNDILVSSHVTLTGEFCQDVVVPTKSRHHHILTVLHPV